MLTDTEMGLKNSRLPSTAGNHPFPNEIHGLFMTKYWHSETASGNQTCRGKIQHSEDF